MDIFNHIILGLLAIGLGVVSLKYNYQLVGITGNVDFAERYIGAGGTYAFYKILSVIFVLGGFLYTTGLGDPVLRWLLSPLAQFFHSPTQQN
jgi:hypothetical protein